MLPSVGDMTMPNKMMLLPDPCRISCNSDPQFYLEPNLKDEQPCQTYVIHLSWYIYGILSLICCIHTKNRSEVSSCHQKWKMSCHLEHSLK